MQNLEKETTISTYDQIAELYSKKNFAPYWIEEMEYFRELLRGKRILDVGCGAGRDAIEFTKYGYKHIGIDASSGMLAQARQRSPASEFLQMDILALDFPEQHFDGFWAVASLLHIPRTKIETVLHKLHSTLKNNGVGFIAIKARIDETKEELLFEEKYKNGARFFSYYTQEEFTEYLEKSSFEVISESSRAHEGRSPRQWLCFFVRKKISNL